jgi:hypothetical protein
LEFHVAAAFLIASILDDGVQTAPLFVVAALPGSRAALDLARSEPGRFVVDRGARIADC